MADYICNQCNKKFSRKWNALRHNKQIHHELAIVYNKATGVDFKNSKESNTTTNYDPFYEQEIEDLNIVDIFGKLMQPFIELEKELVDVKESDKINYISTLIIGALRSSDPVKIIQDAVDFNRSVKGKVKIVNYVAKHMQIPNVQAEQYLNQIIKSSRYFKNYSKTNKIRY